MIHLTITMEHYLETVYELSLENGSVRLSDVAQRMQVSKASANNAMNVLAEKQLVVSEKYREIRLTQNGYQLAHILLEKHNILQQLLRDVIGEDPELADADACAIEHVISPEAIQKINEFLESWYKNRGSET
jgi:DtxR family Mn-dependent transcriptional regulator